MVDINDITPTLAGCVAAGVLLQWRHLVATYFIALRVEAT